MCEEGQITIGNIASDQQAPGPDAAEISIKFASIEIGEIKAGQS